MPAQKRKNEQNYSTPLVAKVRACIVAIVKSLPEAEAVPVGTHFSLEVRKKRIGWYLQDHHGDGRLAVNCKSTLENRRKLETDAPAHFHFPKYISYRGWAGLWLDLPEVDWHQVESLLRDSYRMIAPKSLAAKLDQKIL